MWHLYENKHWYVHDVWTFTTHLVTSKTFQYSLFMNFFALVQIYTTCGASELGQFAKFILSQIDLSVWLYHEIIVFFHSTLKYWRDGNYTGHPTSNIGGSAIDTPADKQTNKNKKSLLKRGADRKDRSSHQNSCLFSTNYIHSCFFFFFGGHNIFQGGTPWIFLGVLPPPPHHHRLPGACRYSLNKKEWICSLFKEWILEKSEIRVNLEWTFGVIHFGVTTGITQGFRVIPVVTPKWVNNTNVHSKFTPKSL